MTRTIIALAIAAISTSAAAQSNRKQPTWDYLLKPLDVKTNPAIPIAPPSPAVPLDQSMTPQTRGGDNALLDGCVIEAIGRLPKVDGLRVTNSSYRYRDSHGQLDFWHVFVSVELHGRQSNYNWLCRIYENRKADLLRDPN